MKHARVFPNTTEYLKAKQMIPTPYVVYTYDDLQSYKNKNICSILLSAIGDGFIVINSSFKRTVEFNFLGDHYQAESNGEKRDFDGVLYEGYVFYIYDEEYDWNAPYKIYINEQLNTARVYDYDNDEFIVDSISNFVVTFEPSRNKRERLYYHAGENQEIFFESDEVLEIQRFDDYMQNEDMTDIAIDMDDMTLTDICIPETVKELGASAFGYCYQLKSILLPKHLETINYGAFKESQQLQEINIPKSVTYIGDFAFSACTSISSIIIPDTIKYIGTEWFSNCFNLTDITFSNKITYIGDTAFYGSGITSFIMPESVKSIGRNAFGECKKLITATTSNNIKCIPDYAFYYCQKLKSIDIGKKVSSIGQRAFYLCYSLTNVNIKDLTAWMNIDFSDGASNPMFYATHLYLNGVEVTHVDNALGKDYTFRNCASLESVTFSNDATRIGREEFIYCRQLTYVNISNSVTSIGEDAFSYCEGLTNIVIPDSVTFIGSFAFSYCKNLDVYIPSSVSSIGLNAFYNVKHIEYHGTATGAPWGAKSMN